MKRVNLIIVLSKDNQSVLMCYRKKDPYKGQYNFVGGKVGSQEDDLSAAYRELYEETGISKDSIDIKKLFFTHYFEDNLELQVFYGTLKHNVSLKEEVNPLVWFDIKTDFSKEKFAGDGNIQHMMKCIEFYQKEKSIHQS